MFTPFEDGWTTLVSLGFTVEFGEESVILTKRYGSVTVDDVRTITTYVKPDLRYMVFKSDYDKVIVG